MNQGYILKETDKMKNNHPPVLFKDKNFTKPDFPFYYLIAANGTFLVKKFRSYSSCVKVTNLPNLQHQKERIEFDFPKIPKSIMESSVGFFKEVYKRYKSEAIVLIYYNPENKKFKINIPKQEVDLDLSWGNNKGNYELKYKRIPTPKGLIRLGTIHSHADLPAYYSYTDETDSRFDDSLNIVVGNVNTSKPSFYACFMVDGALFEIPDYKDVTEGFQKVRKAPDNWLEKVSQVVSNGKTYYSNSRTVYRHG